MYCGRRNQSNLSLNSCEPVQPAVLRLRLPPSVFILKQLFLSNLCSTCTSPSFYLLPPPKELFRQVFCFVSVRISREPSTQASELIYRNALMCERGGVDFSCIYGEKTKKKVGLMLSETCVCRKQGGILASSGVLCSCCGGGMIRFRCACRIFSAANNHL